MCGRFTLTDPGQIPLRFDVEVDADTLLPRYNIAPSQLVPVVVERPEGRALQHMRWGFQPAWAPAAPNRPAPINARAETLLERPLFRGAVARRRCLIAADGFYEWQDVGRGPKQPVYIRLRSGGLFAFAGLYTDNGAVPATCASGRCIASWGWSRRGRTRTSTRRTWARCAPPRSRTRTGTRWRRAASREPARPPPCAGARG